MNRFINSLDPDRVFFQQADIDRFMSNSAKIDDAIKREDLQIPFSIFNIYEQRVVDRMNYARGLLKREIRFRSAGRLFPVAG
jgi:carboxyl-terminal processing protease